MKGEFLSEVNVNIPNMAPTINGEHQR